MKLNQTQSSWFELGIMGPQTSAQVRYKVVNYEANIHFCAPDSPILESSLQHKIYVLFIIIKCHLTPMR